LQKKDLAERGTHIIFIGGTGTEVSKDELFCFNPSCKRPSHLCINFGQPVIAALKQ